MLVATPVVAAGDSPFMDLLGIDNPIQRVGQPTQAEGGPTVPTAAAAPAGPANLPPNAQPVLQPFGASLFTGGPAGATNPSNPNYIIQVGDRVDIRVWGGVTAESTDAVDSKGNVFLVGIGPVHVAGVAAANLQAAVQHQLGAAFTNNVQIYAVLLGTHQTGVFVTGFVRAPGRYTGAASDSALDYLIRAGGVDPSRGSYRNIVLQRDGKTIVAIDLYQFLLSGTLPPVNLREGDTLFVAKQYPMVAAVGSVRNNYLFELPGVPALGSTIIDLARPLPAATHALVKGTRDNHPFSVYVSVADLAKTPVYDQDQIAFVTDAPADTVTVQVQGSRIGPSVLVADRDVRLPDLLNYIAVDPALADTKSIYILRQGLAQQQGQAVKAALDRLEQSLFQSNSSSTGEAQIRASEAQLIASYIQKGRQVQPEGRLVASNDDGTVANIRLEDNDIIVIPEKSQVVLVSGEVAIPQAVIYRSDLTAENYIAAAGGFTVRGSAGNYMIRRANGNILLDPATPLRPGDELIVLPSVGPKYFQLGRDLVQVIYELAVSAHLGGAL